MTRKAAIFDLDGTLLNTLDDITLCMNQTLMHFGLDTRTAEEYKLMIGTGAYDLVKKAVQSCMPLVQEDFIKKILDYYTARLGGIHAKGGSVPYSGIRKVLTALMDSGIKLAVLSNKPDEATRAAVSHSLPDISFAHVQGQKNGFPRKPDAMAANMIIEDLSVKKDEVVYFGDSGVDMQTAKNTGLYAVGVLWGYRGKVELLSCGADVLIEKPEDIFGFFEQDAISNL